MKSVVNGFFINSQTKGLLFFSTSHKKQTLKVAHDTKIVYKTMKKIGMKLNLTSLLLFLYFVCTFSTQSCSNKEKADIASDEEISSIIEMSDFDDSKLSITVIPDSLANTPYYSKLIALQDSVNLFSEKMLDMAKILNVQGNDIDNLKLLISLNKTSIGIGELTGNCMIQIQDITKHLMGGMEKPKDTIINKIQALSTTEREKILTMQTSNQQLANDVLVLQRQCQKKNDELTQYLKEIVYSSPQKKDLPQINEKCYNTLRSSTQWKLYKAYVAYMKNSIELINLIHTTLYK